MRRSITNRLVVMFALTALAMFTLVGAVLYGVLERELTRHQNDDLNTNLQNMRYSIERFGDLEHWPRLQTKMDTLTPADGSVRFWVLSDDPRFLYGKGLDEMERVNQGEAGHGMLTMPSSGRRPMRAIHQPSAMTSATTPSVSSVNAMRNARNVCSNGAVSTPTISRTGGRSENATMRIDSVR